MTEKPATQKHYIDVLRAIDRAGAGHDDIPMELLADLARSTDREFVLRRREGLRIYLVVELPMVEPLSNLGAQAHITANTLRGLGLEVPNAVRESEEHADRIYRQYDAIAAALRSVENQLIADAAKLLEVLHG